jgi:hypothetical protein
MDGRHLRRDIALTRLFLTHTGQEESSLYVAFPPNYQTA